MAPFPIGTFVETFFDQSKDDARRLIRREIESMLDPLVESLFKQLKVKFVHYLDTSSLSGYYFHQLAHDRGVDEHLIRDQQTMSNSQQYQCQSLSNVPSMDANCQLNSSNHQPALTSIKEEINDSSNVQLEQHQNSYSTINSSSSTQESSFYLQSMNPSTPIDKSLSNQNKMKQQQQSHIKANEYDDDDYDEECDCDECVYGSIDLKEEDDLNDDFQLIEHDQESSPPVKKPRIHPNHQSKVIIEQCRNIEQSKDQQQPNQVVNNHNDKPIIITHELQCTELNCFETFVPNSENNNLVDQLKDHWWNAHSIGPFRCLVKDCIESFEKRNNLGTHLNQAHPNNSQWHCFKCVKHFPAYNQLSIHNLKFHQLGRFQCSFAQCNFTGENRGKVYEHYKQHKPELICQSCDYRTSNSTRLKAHVRATHLGIKPYRCKWPNCDYTSASQDYTMSHIRRIHFISNSMTGSSNYLATFGKPKDYLEVVMQ